MDDKKLYGLLVLDLKRGYSTIFTHNGYEKLLKDRELGYKVINFKNIDKNFPIFSSIIASNNFQKKGGIIVGVVVNDPYIKFIPGFEYLPLFKEDFSLYLSIEDSYNKTIKFLKSKVKENSPSSEKIHILNIFYGNGGGPFKLFIDMVPHIQKYNIKLSSIALLEENTNFKIPQKLNSRFISYSDLDMNFPTHDGFINMRRYEELTIKLTSEINRKEKIDLIHIHTHLGLAGKIMKNILDIPYLITQHVTEKVMENSMGRLNEDYIYYTPDLRENIMDSFRKESELIENSNGVIAVSKYGAAEILNNFSIEQNKIYYIPNSISLDKKNHGELYKYISKTSKNKLIISFVGTLSPIKGGDIFFKISEELLKDRTNIDIYVAGPEWSGHNYVENWLSDNQFKDKIKLLGRIDSNEVYDLLSLSDIIIIPSRYESFSLVALEAMSQGAIPIVSDNGGISEIIFNDFNGFIVNNNNLNEYLEKINKLINNREKFHKLKNSGKIVLEEYDINKSSEKMANLYHKIVEDNLNFKNR